MAVAVFSHPSSLLHNPGPGHPESPARLKSVLGEFQQMAKGGVVNLLEAAAAERELLEKVHPKDYLDRLEALSEKGGAMIDGDTFLSADTYEAAVFAAGQMVAAADSALDGTHSFAAVRPPGHHATSDVAMGFCFINNVVVAAIAALQRDGVHRVLIVDWDVHHGNGTQALVESDERIRFVSMHQWPLYPGTGRESERGVGNVFNLPQPPGLPPD
ncbi:MAG: histone deacetylase, partial [Gemmatimonadota bacterium]|nr:histone deacetylase [Gemmatimonadota bacterium]